MIRLRAVSGSGDFPSLSPTRRNLSAPGNGCRGSRWLLLGSSFLDFKYLMSFEMTLTGLA